MHRLGHMTGVEQQILMEPQAQRHGRRLRTLDEFGQKLEIEQRRGPSFSE